MPFGLRWRDQLPPVVVDEFENLINDILSHFSASHDEDGNVTPEAIEDIVEDIIDARNIQGTLGPPGPSGDGGDAGLHGSPGHAELQDLTGSGIQGSIPFFGPSSRLAQDNATFFWDNVNKRLGIGTNTTLHALQVLGHGYFDTSLPLILASITDNPLAAGATTVNVDTTTGYESAGFFKLDAEVIKYTGKTATSFTGCVRGRFATTDTSHVLGTQPRPYAFILAPAETTSVGVFIQADGSVGINNPVVGTAGFGASLDISTPSYGGLGTIRVNGSGFGQAISANEATISVTNSGGSPQGGIYANRRLFTFFDVQVGQTSGITSPALPGTGSGGIIFAGRDAFTPVVYSSMAANTAGLYADEVDGITNIFGINESDERTQLTGAGGAMTPAKVSTRVLLGI